MGKNVHNQNIGIEWATISNPLLLGSIELRKFPFGQLLGQFKFSNPSGTASLAHSTKCLSGSFNAGVKIEITTNGSLPVFFRECTLPIGLK